jgi:hypothetical protein
VRDRLELPAHLLGHRPRVIAEALLERSLQPSTAIGVRKQPIDPRAQIDDQRPGGLRFARHGSSLAHTPHAAARA